VAEIPGNRQTRIGEKKMSELNKSDIVEFLCDNGDSKFGLIIDIRLTDSIDALVVADLGSISKPYWIPRHRVKACGATFKVI
jgi:hypothetical protein